MKSILNLAAAAALVFAGSVAQAGGYGDGNEDVNSYSSAVTNSAVGAGSFTEINGNGAAFHVSGGKAGAVASNHGYGVSAWDGAELGNVEIGGTFAESVNVSNVLTGTAGFSYGTGVGSYTTNGGVKAGADGLASGITQTWSEYGDIETN